MGLEGAVKLGFKKELDATPNETERQALYDNLSRMNTKKEKPLMPLKHLNLTKSSTL